MLIDKKDYREKLFLFKDREDAGKKLAKFLEENLPEKTDLIILAIPRGGVPIGCILARLLNAVFDLILVRKIPIPWNPEAGLGAVTSDGDVFIDEKLVDYLRIDEKTLEQLISDVLKEIKRREKKYLGDKKYVELRDKNVIVVDDGLATGYTMLAAINHAKKFKPKKIYVGVPTASKGAVSLLMEHVDSIFCLNVRSGVPYFAVADAYENWRDLTDEDVFRYLEIYHCGSNFRKTRK